MDKRSSKDKLISATIEAICENGLHSVTTAKIANKAKLSEAMIYKTFGNKDDMIIASFLEIKKELNNYVISRLDSTMDFESKNYSIWQSHLNYFIGNPQHLRVLNQIEHSNYMTQEVRKSCLSYSNEVISFFQLGITKKVFKQMHIEVAIALFFSPIISIAEAIVESRVPDNEETREILYSSTMDALKT